MDSVGIKMEVQFGEFARLCKDTLAKNEARPCSQIDCGAHGE
jgi:hypothetical protein